jgi:hypothetical protein
MTFHSILFESEVPASERETQEAPVFFVDLNLDQVINTIVMGRQEYHLKPFFYTPLRDVDTIYYRHEIMQDLENSRLMASMQPFAEKMALTRRYLALVEKLDFKYHRQGWFLEAALVYCEAVTILAQGLSLAEIKSRGFFSLREYV